MEMKFIDKKNQEYDISHVVDIMQCDCSECNFMSCPKNNYIPEKERYIYTVDEFIDINKSTLLKDGFTGELIIEFFEDCVKYPSNFYFNLDDIDKNKINIIRMNKNGDSKKATIMVDGSSFINYNMEKSNYNKFLKVFSDIRKINDFINNK